VEFPERYAVVTHSSPQAFAAALISIQLQIAEGVVSEPGAVATGSGSPALLTFILIHPTQAAARGPRPAPDTETRFSRQADAFYQIVVPWI
jgi:hypothetical protein